MKKIEIFNNGNELSLIQDTLKCKERYLIHRNEKFFALEFEGEYDGEEGVRMVIDGYSDYLQSEHELETVAEVFAEDNLMKGTLHYRQYRLVEDMAFDDPTIEDEEERAIARLTLDYCEIKEMNVDFKTAKLLKEKIEEIAAEKNYKIKDMKMDYGFLLSFKINKIKYTFYVYEDDIACNVHTKRGDEHTLMHFDLDDIDGAANVINNQ